MDAEMLRPHQGTIYFFEELTMHHRRLFSLSLVLVFLASFLLSGCSQTGGVSITATSTALPATATLAPSATFTLVPTDTPTSTPSPSPSPSPTPNLQATDAANTAATAEAANAVVAPFLKDFGVDPAQGHLAWLHEAEIKQEVTTYLEKANYVIQDAGQVSSFVMQSKITWDTSGALSLCGFTFFGEEDLKAGAYNQLLLMRLQYAPKWTIWRWDYGQFQYHLASNWLSSRDIRDDNKSSNVLSLVVQDKDITVYINGDKQRQVEDTKFKKGLLALSTYQESGTTTCKFRDSWVWVFDK
jgi:hypothetical protein